MHTKSLLATLLFTASVSFAQTPTAALSGVVRDEQGGVITRAAVSVRNSDTGKARSRSVDEEGRIRFFGHETLGSKIAVEVCRRYRLSTVEQAEVEMTVLHHMRPEWLEADGEPTRRATRSGTVA